MSTIGSNNDSTRANNRLIIKANDWFNSGERIAYDPVLMRVGEPFSNSSFKVFRKVVTPSALERDVEWQSFLPGFPDGSYGWSHVSELMAGGTKKPMLFVEYVGQGDSDKPENYTYSTMERANLVEAQWRDLGIKETFVITFDYSSIVLLELLSRQAERLAKGQRLYTRITNVLMMNGGLFADSHTHPFMTTPLLKTSIGKMGAKMAQDSRFAFDMMMQGLWSKQYGVTKAELAEFHNAISRRNGAVFMSDAAGFVDEHKQNSLRWDLKRLFESEHLAVDFHIAGSKEDPFEYKQVKAAQERLSPAGLEITMFPGGHMTTSEHPDLIVELIHKIS